MMERTLDESDCQFINVALAHFKKTAKAGDYRRAFAGMEFDGMDVDDLDPEEVIARGHNQCDTLINLLTD